MKVLLKFFNNCYSGYSKVSAKIGGVFEDACGKTKITKKAYNNYSETKTHLKHLFNVGRRAGRIYKHQNKVVSVFSGLNMVRKEVGYFPMLTATASSVAGNIIFPSGIPYSSIGLMGGIALKSSAKALFRFVC